MRKLISLLIGIILLNISNICSFAGENQSGREPLIVKKCTDFRITGDGSNPEWRKVEWNPLVKLDPGGQEDKSRFKIIYSCKGIYLLFDGDDQKITTKFDKDFDYLFEGDVFEAFFHPDPKFPLYLEYEINQLDKELVLIIPNINGKFQGWVPWNYENDNKVVKNVSVIGGNVKPGCTIKSWSAELFFPFRLFKPLSNVPAVSGTIWNANFCRLDYDSGKMIKWAWSPIKNSFHEFEKYRPIRFE